jgi:ribonuclease BN (tRNA processing enzyme)
MDSAAADPARGVMSLLVAGCDGSWTGPGGAGSGYVVSAGGTRILVDAGPGSFANLQRRLDPAHLDAVVISHHHPDHWTDLYPLITHRRFTVDGPPVPVFAPADLAEHADLTGAPEVEWRPVTDGETVVVGSVTCRFHRTDHTFETLAVRMESGGRALGYSADSGPGWSLSELGSDLDLALCEATYTAEFEGTAQHMSGRQAGAQARAAGAGRLVVTHRWPTIPAAALAAEAARAFGKPVEQATIGGEFVL